MSSSLDPEQALHDHYERGLEQDRLASPLGVVEFERTKEIVARRLPPTPGVVADIGGGSGPYALWLAAQGHAVIHRDLVPLHVEQLRSAASNAGLDIETGIGDARTLDIADAAADVVLLFGPLYHLHERGSRLQALREARRIVRPGGAILGVAISRWAARLHGELIERATLARPAGSSVPIVEATGVIQPSGPGGFTGYTHRPDEFRAEFEEAGLIIEDVVGIEGIAYALSDLEQRLADPADRAALFAAARDLERVPELLGMGPHILVTARRP